MLIFQISWPIYLFVFIFGAIIMSFIGLVVIRLPHQLEWVDNPKKNLTICTPRSHCDNCNTQIKLGYLLPIIGYVFCLGRCDKCGWKIPIYYPILELFGGLIAITLLYFYGLSSTFILVALLIFSLLFLAWIDIKEHWLPAVVTVPLFWIGLLYSPFNFSSIERIQGAAVGFLMTYIAMWLTSKIIKEDVMAGGDIALITVAGAWLGINLLLYYIMVSCLVFTIYAIPSRLRGVKFCAMGPALCCGFIILLYPLIKNFNLI